jgi:hypothetical protein
MNVCTVDTALRRTISSTDIAISILLRHYIDAKKMVATFSAYIGRLLLIIWQMLMRRLLLSVFIAIKPLRALAF